jgi:hypothetical protein
MKFREAADIFNTILRCRIAVQHEDAAFQIVEDGLIVQSFLEGVNYP